MPRIRYRGYMAKGCHHRNPKRRGYVPHYHAHLPSGVELSEPSGEEIRENRLWEASCGHWVSFLGRFAPGSVAP